MCQSHFYHPPKASLTLSSVQISHPGRILRVAVQEPKIIMVHLRQPRRSEKPESRSDPFYELGSFGCTGCHRRNLMHPKRIEELDGVRIAFAQGGPLGFRLIHLTPPVSVVKHGKYCELIWRPAIRPFKYAAAPVLINAAGHTDFPMLPRVLRSVRRSSWPARFSSAFRTRRTPLPNALATEIARTFDRLRGEAKSHALARTYIEALPREPNAPDENRKDRLAKLRAKATGKTSRCTPRPTKEARATGC
jgi:hypothetical protein